MSDATGRRGSVDGVCLDCPEGDHGIIADGVCVCCGMGPTARLIQTRNRIAR